MIMMLMLRCIKRLVLVRVWSVCGAEEEEYLGTYPPKIPASYFTIFYFHFPSFITPTTSNYLLLCYY